MATRQLAEHAKQAKTIMSYTGDDSEGPKGFDATFTLTRLLRDIQGSVWSECQCSCYAVTVFVQFTRKLYDAPHWSLCSGLAQHNCLSREHLVSDKVIFLNVHDIAQYVRGKLQISLTYFHVTNDSVQVTLSVIDILDPTNLYQEPPSTSTKSKQ